jgi:hypothetical protein
MKRNFDTFLTDVERANGPVMVLLFGDDLEVESACKLLMLSFPGTRENSTSSGSTAAQRHGIRLNPRF